MKIGYARVSTDEQCLDLQVQALEAAGCEKIFEDPGVDGARVSRLGLEAALAAAREGDVLVVWKLDRLGRSLRYLIDTIRALREAGIGFRSLQEQFDTLSAGGRFYFHMLGALAEFERELIAERTRAGMASARRRGVHLGRPRKISSKALKATRARLEAGDESPKEAATRLRVSVATLHRALNKKEAG